MEEYQNGIYVKFIKLHPDYEGVYYLAEPWGGNPHFAKADRSQHIYYYWKNTNGWGWWTFDDRDQKNNTDDINGGYHNGG